MVIDRYNLIVTRHYVSNAIVQASAENQLVNDQYCKPKNTVGFIPIEKAWLMSLPDPQNFPPLPEITCEKIFAQIYTHRSMYGRPVHQFEDSPDDPAPDNESLEHLGDSVLNYITTTLIRDMYPHIHVGPATKIRGMVVKNNNLAVLSVGYKMNDSLRGHHSQIVALRNSPNIQADIFEAYVGGLYLTEGLEATRTWLSTLFQPFIVNAYNIVRAEYYPSMTTVAPPSMSPDTALPPPREPGSEADLPIPDITDAMEGMSLDSSNPERTSGVGMADPPITITTPTTTTPPARPTYSPPSQIPSGHLMLFNEYVEKNKLVVSWQWDRSNNASGDVGTYWEARVLLGDECVGIGKARNKRVAKHEAASEALKKLNVLPTA